MHQLVLSYYKITKKSGLIFNPSKATRCSLQSKQTKNTTTTERGEVTVWRVKRVEIKGHGVTNA